MPYVPLRDGESLYVRVVGRGTPVLMLPGLGMNSLHWLPFVLPFAHRHRFYMPDFRGFGRSSHVRLAGADPFQSHADDVREVIAHFGLADFLVAGISLGGTTTLHLARDHGLPGVRRYLHIDQSPCVGNREGWAHGLLGAGQEAFFAELREVHVLLMRHPSAKRVRDLPPQARERAADAFARIVTVIGDRPRSFAMVRRALLAPSIVADQLPLAHLDDARAYLGAYLAGGHDYRPVLPTLTTPIVVMIGMNSPLYPPEGQLAVAALAMDARVVRFERSGHVPLVDEPRKFLREFGRFLAEG